MRTGILSDQSVMLHCAKYQAVPLGKAMSILSHNQVNQRKPLFGRKLKHTQTPPRPESFDTMAKSVARISGNPKIHTELEKQYNEELKTAPLPPMIYHIPGPPRRGANLTAVSTSTTSTQTENGNGNGNGGYSTDSSDTVQVRPRLDRTRAEQIAGSVSPEFLDRARRVFTGAPRRETLAMPQYRLDFGESEAGPSSPDANRETPEEMLERFARRGVQSTNPADVRRSQAYLDRLDKTRQVI